MSLNKFLDLNTKIRKEKLKEDTSFSVQLNKDFSIYFEKQFEKKVAERVKQKKAKKKVNIFMLLTLVFSFINIVSANPLLINVLIQLFVGGAFFYYLLNFYKIKLNNKEDIKFENHRSLELKISLEFENSFASNDLIEAYKETFGCETFNKILFKNESDLTKIKIKDLNNSVR